MSTLLELPEIVLEKILSYLSFDEIAKKRIVCRDFNVICGKLLNKGYLAVEKYNNRCLKAIKAKLPRRESERRTHPLAKHSDIFSGIETRLSMLSMTFMKYISIGICCFIPGKVIDEVYRVIRFMEFYDNDTPPRTLNVLQELRDISSMAMEHFEEKIVPLLKSKQESQCCPSYPIPDGPVRRFENFHRHFLNLRSYEKQKSDLICKLNHKVKSHHRHLTSHVKKFKTFSTIINEQNAQINELKQRLEDWEHRLRELETVNRAKDDIPSLEDAKEEVERDENCSLKRKCSITPETSYLRSDENQPLKKTKLSDCIE